MKVTIRANNDADGNLSRPTEAFDFDGTEAFKQLEPRNLTKIRSWSFGLTTTKATADDFEIKC